MGIKLLSQESSEFGYELLFQSLGSYGIPKLLKLSLPAGFQKEKGRSVKVSFSFNSGTDTLLLPPELDILWNLINNFSLIPFKNS